MLCPRSNYVLSSGSFSSVKEWLRNAHRNLPLFSLTSHLVACSCFHSSHYLGTAFLKLQASLQARWDVVIPVLFSVWNLVEFIETSLYELGFDYLLFL